MAALLAITLVLLASPVTLAQPYVKLQEFFEVLVADVNPRNTSGTTTAQVYRTIGWNDFSHTSWGDVTGSLSSQLNASVVGFSGPRYWLISYMKNDTAPLSNKTYSAGGLNVQQFGSLEGVNTNAWPKSSWLNYTSFYTPYHPMVTQRKVDYAWLVGKSAFFLNDTHGNLFIMESYSQLIDHELTVYSMPWLPNELKLPRGWNFINTTLSQTLNVTTTRGSPGYSIVLFDDMSNMYTYAGTDYNTVLAQYSVQGATGASGAASTIPGLPLPAHVRNDRYCEIVVANSTSTTVFNTYGVNDCDTDTWNGINHRIVRRMYNGSRVTFNGPRYWQADFLENGTDIFATRTTKNIQGLRFRVINAKGSLDRSETVVPSFRTPYVPAAVEANVNMMFSKDSTAYILTDDHGNRFIMHSYSSVIGNITADSLRNLSSHLHTLPKNWTYATIKLFDNYNVTTPSVYGGNPAYIFVLQDDFANAYSCLDCNPNEIIKQYNMVLPNSTVSTPKAAAATRVVSVVAALLSVAAAIAMAL